MKGLKTVFGENVRKFRLLKKWSQAELAEKIEVSDAFLAHVERGTRGVSMETIELLARCFEIPYTALFEENSNSSENYSEVLFSLEKELKEKINKEIENCISNSKKQL